MADRKTFNSNTRGDDYRDSQKDLDVTREVEELIKAKLSDQEAWQRLRNKYPNNQDLVDKILDARKNIFQNIYKRAKKFKQIILNRYGNLGLNRADLLRKAKKYVRKYKFTDPEFDLFEIILNTDSSSKYAYTLPSSQMAKTLGYDTFVATSSKLNVKPTDQAVVEEIVNKYGETKPLHAQVILQTLMYQDNAPEALSGCFDSCKDNAFAYVHPVIAALFIPKVELLEEQMLLSNIGYIVQRKAEEKPIMTLPDYKLYWDMVVDPNDLACTTINPIVDLRNRYHLQAQLWDAVFKLRQGKYYYSELSGLNRFMQALENCRNIIHDAPDLTYVKDEGTILRRLLSAFSLYPTYVSVNRLWNLFMGSTYGLPSSPLDVTGYGNVKRVPMIPLRLPPTIANNAVAVSLEEALTQPQWYVENKVIVPKSLQIIHSNEVIFFYVGRRYQTINIARLGIPCNFSNLPMSVSGWEKINEHPVNAPRHMTIGADTFELRSVVLVEKTQVQNTGMVVGSSAMIVVPMDPSKGRFQETCILYDPQGAAVMLEEGSGYVRNKPITTIPCEQSFMGAAGGVESFDQRACSRGTIFMYKKIPMVPIC